MAIFCDSTTIIRSCILRIAIFTIDGVLDKFLGIVLAAFSINHARCIRLLITTGAMKHTIGNSMVKKRMELGIWDLGRYNGVNLLSITNFIILMQPNKKMNMW